MNLLFAFVTILLFCFSYFCISKMNQTSKEGDGDGNRRSPSCLTWESHRRSQEEREMRDTLEVPCPDPGLYRWRAQPHVPWRLGCNRSWEPP